MTTATTINNQILGLDVDVYFNLHRKCWSVRDRYTRRVVAHLDSLTLFDVRFRVSAAGNARVRAEGRKNVHAFARGILVNNGSRPDADAISVTYNPYKYTTFVDAADESPVHVAHTAWFAGRSVTAQPWSDKTTVPVPLDSRSLAEVA